MIMRNKYTIAKRSLANRYLGEPSGCGLRAYHWPLEYSVNGNLWYVCDSGSFRVAKNLFSEREVSGSTIKQLLNIFKGYKTGSYPTRFLSRDLS